MAPVPTIDAPLPAEALPPVQEAGEPSDPIISDRQAGHETGRVQSVDYRVPADLRASETSHPKVLMLGSCLMHSWEMLLRNHSDGPDVTLYNVLDLPKLDADEIAAFDYQIIHVTFRHVLPEAMFYNLKADDAAGYAEAFRISCMRLDHALELALRFNREHGLPTFVMNFLPPQQNLLGRLAPRYALSNPVHFVEKINEHLATQIENLPGVHLVDYDQIVCNLGRRYFQDDLTMSSNHHSLLGPLDQAGDLARLEPPGDVAELYGDNQWEYVVAVWREIDAMYRSIRQTDAIKIVIFDLDDTLWRGVAADADEVAADMAEGWPLGMVEAASYLWRRGIVLAIVSKNDDDVALRAWNTLYGRIFPIENFAVRRINWEPKAQNIAEILAAVNLLPGNALFVDDNPVERAQVREAFPAIRLIEGPVATWRRLLLWAPELQTATFTAESANRTAMLQAQIARDAQGGGAVDRAAFLASLSLEISTTVVRDEGDAGFQRCFELLNKTNQFNTTGRRWSPAEMHALFRAGGVILALAAKDRFTAYGTVALAILSGDAFVQVVMSCRVFGMGIEQALVSIGLSIMHDRGIEAATGEIVDTERNRLSRTLYETCGFTSGDGHTWRRAVMSPPAIPSHIQRIG